MKCKFKSAEYSTIFEELKAKMLEAFSEDSDEVRDLQFKNILEVYKSDAYNLVMSIMK